MTSLTLVTGATGLIGREVVSQLRRRGTPTRVLVRDPDRLDTVEWDGIEICRGDLSSPLRLAGAMRGVDTVLHLAAHARAWSRDPDTFVDVNIAGVRDLLAAATAAGVRRLVHVSTVMAHPSLVGRRLPSRNLTAYEETKLAGDRLVEAAVAQGLDAVIVHPTRVYGPGPLGPSNGVTRLIDAAIRSPLLLRLADRGAPGNYVHVADVAKGILLAAEHGRIGGRYLLGGENLSVGDLIALVDELSGHHPTVLAVPAALAVAAAHLAVAGGWLGLPVAVTPDWVRVFLEDQSVDIIETCRELGYAPRSIRDGLEETIQWLRFRGHPERPLGYPLRA